MNSSTHTERYVDGWEEGHQWAKTQAEAIEFDLLMRPGLVRVDLTLANAPTLLDRLTDGVGDTYRLDMSDDHDRGLRDSTLAIYEAATDTGYPSKDEPVDLTTDETQQILARIERTRLLADEAAYERGHDLGSDWVDEADPDEIEALRDLDLNATWDQDLYDIGLPSLAEWLTNHGERGRVHSLNLTDPFHQGVINSALAAIPDDISVA